MKLVASGKSRNIRVSVSQSILGTFTGGDQLDDKKDRRPNWTLGRLQNCARALDEKQRATPSKQLHRLFSAILGFSTRSHRPLSRAYQ